MQERLPLKRVISFIILHIIWWLDKFKMLKRSAIDIGSISRTHNPFNSLVHHHFVALTVMPASIDVVDFAKARSEEIRMLKKDIEDAKYRGARRVFQTLPRAMRRRAASHNIKRLPTRLRNKAIEEVCT